MRTDVWYDSQGTGRIHACRWESEREIRAVLKQEVYGDETRWIWEKV